MSAAYSRYVITDFFAKISVVANLCWVRVRVSVRLVFTWAHVAIYPRLCGEGSPASPAFARIL